MFYVYIMNMYDFVSLSKNDDEYYLLTSDGAILGGGRKNLELTFSILAKPINVL